MKGALTRREVWPLLYEAIANKVFNTLEHLQELLTNTMRIHGQM